MTASVKSLKLRVYAEGIEIPAISATFNGGLMMASQAAIQVVPTDDIHDLLPRTMISLGWRDDDSHEAGDQAYKVVWEGEYMGYRFIKSASGQRSAVLLCGDFTTYWDCAKMFYLNAEGMSSSKAKDAAFVGATISKYGGVDSARPQSPASAIYKILTGAPASIPGLRGLLGGLVHMIERIGGLYKGKKKFRGLNDFFSAAEVRLKLMQMIGASPKDTTSVAMFKTREFRRWIKRTIGKRGATFSFRQVLELMLKRVFHQYTSVPCAYYRGASDTWVDVYKRTGTSRLPSDLKAEAEGELQYLQAEYANITSAKTPTGEERAGRDVLAASATAYQNAQADHERLDKNTDKVNTTLYDQKDQKAVESFRQAQTAHRGYVLDANQALSDGEVGLPGEQTYTDFTENPPASVDKARKSLKKAIEAYEKALTGKGVYKKQRTKVRVFDRYLQTVFSPDLWFAAPPRPNIIFPDEYSMFSFQREFMAETTRLQLTSKQEYVSPQERATGDGAGKKMYWSPLIDDVTGKLSKVSARKGARFIMAHEIYTGIIPRFEFVPNITGFKKTDKEDRTEKSPIPYLQRIANFLFFKFRYGPRTGVLKMPFTPRLIPGHPCVVIDRFISDGVRAELGIEPTQYLGVIQRVDHALNQAGGTTTVTLTHLRTHREQADFLGAGNVTVVKRVGSKKKRHKSKAKVDIDPLTGKPLGNPRIIELRETGQEVTKTGWYDDSTFTETEMQYDVAPKYNSSDVAVGPDGKMLQDAHPGPLEEQKITGAVVGAKGPSGGKIESIEVDVPKDVDGLAAPPPTEYITEYADLDEDAKLDLLSREDPTQPSLEGVRSVIADVTVVERIGVYKKFKVQLPLEEVVRPPWVASMYDNANIGDQYYMDMFGCRSIVDPLTVGEPTGRPGGLDAGASADGIPRKKDLKAGPLTEDSYDSIIPDFGGTATDQASLAAVSSAKTSAASGLYGDNEKGPMTVAGLGAGMPNAELDEALRRTEKLVGQIQRGAWIIEAVEELVKVYRQLKLSGASTRDFIRQITWRPIASIVDIMGSADLVYDEDTGKPLDSKMAEGFHSRAFGPYKGLAFLDHKASTEGDGTGELRKIDEKIDPREERWLRVQTYAESLRRSRGLLG